MCDLVVLATKATCTCTCSMRIFVPTRRGEPGNEARLRHNPSTRPCLVDSPSTRSPIKSCARYMHSEGSHPEQVLGMTQHSHSQFLFVVCKIWLFPVYCKHSETPWPRTRLSKCKCDGIVVFTIASNLRAWVRGYGLYMMVSSNLI